MYHFFEDIALSSLSAWQYWHLEPPWTRICEVPRDDILHLKYKPHQLAGAFNTEAMPKSAFDWSPKYIAFSAQCYTLKGLRRFVIYSRWLA